MKKYFLQNLDCPNCAAKLESEIGKLACVHSVAVNFATLSMQIDTSDIAAVQKTIDAIEPGVTIADSSTQKKPHQESFNVKKELIFIGVTAAAYIAAFVFQKKLEATPYHIAEYLAFTVIYIAAGHNVLSSAWRNITHGKVFDENFLMTIATLGAFAIHALPEAAGVMFFFKVGEFFQDLSIARSRRSIKALLEIKPDYAHRMTGGIIKTVSPLEVAVGDTVLVKPGEKVPLDGKITAGESFLDTSALTGESVLRSAHTGADICAGMINTTGLLTIKVTKVFGESSISKILDLVENATSKKAKTEQFFTTFAKYYTPAIVAISCATAILPPVFFGEQFTTWIYRALVILVISCPCALVVSIPLAYFGGIGGASKRGILIKGSNYLEVLAHINTVVFDKTGTLTKGTFSVTEIVSYNGFSRDELLRYAAEAESHSNHPIAASIAASYKNEIDKSRIRTYREIGGHGIEATVEDYHLIAGNDRLLHKFAVEHDTCHVSGTVVHVAVDKKYAGYIIISDEVKDDSAEALAALKKAGIKKLIMLTGDGKATAEKIARELGVDSFYAELLPEDKVSLLEKIMSGSPKDRVAFAGDGINDAPVIARADVGISMGNAGTDAAIETADVVIMNDSLLKISEAVKISRKTKKILVQNITFALGIKLLFIVLGFMGIATMWEAVFGDVGVALIAVLNATRTLRSS